MCVIAASMTSGCFLDNMTRSSLSCLLSLPLQNALEDLLFQ